MQEFTISDELNQWKKITDFIHDNTSTKIGIQLGHSGRKGATKKRASRAADQWKRLGI